MHNTSNVVLRLRRVTRPIKDMRGFSPAKVKNLGAGFLCELETGDSIEGLEGPKIPAKCRENRTDTGRQTDAWSLLFLQENF